MFSLLGDSVVEDLISISPLFFQCKESANEAEMTSRAFGIINERERFN